MSNSFVNLERQLEKCGDLSALPLEEALCLMDMVTKDTLAVGLPIENLSVESWTRLRKFLLSLTGTLNRIYSKHGATLGQRERPIPQKSQDSLRSAEETLRRLEQQEAGLRDEIRELEQIVSRQKLKDQLVTELLSEKDSLQQRISRLKSVDLTRLEQERDQLAETAAALAQQISRQKDENEANSRSLQSDRGALAREQQRAETLRGQLETTRQELEGATAHCDALSADLGSCQNTLQTQLGEKEQLERQLQSLVLQLQKCSSQSQALTEQIRQRKAELDRLSQSIAALTQTNEALSGQLRDRRTELQTLEARKQQLEQQLQTALTDRQQLENALTQLDTLLKNTADTHTRLQKQLSEGEALLQERLNAVSELERTLSDQSAALSGINDESRSLEARLAGLEAELDASRNRHGELSERHQQLLDTVQTLKQTITSLEEAIAGLENDRILLLQQKADLENTLAENREEYNALLSEFHELEAFRAALEQTLAEYTAKKNALEHTVAGLRETRQTLQTETDRLQQERDGLSAELEQLSARREELPRQIRTVTEDRDGCAAECDQLQQTLDTLNTELETASARKTGLDSDLTAARQRKAQLDDECRQLQTLLDQLSGVERERSETALRQQETERALREAEAALQTLIDTIAEHTRQANELNDRAAALQADCTAAGALHEQAQIEHDALCRSLETTRQSTEAINTRRIELQSQLNEAEADLKSAKADAGQKEQDLSAAAEAYRQINTSILTLGRQLQQQVETNTDYHDNHLLPARLKLEQSQASLVRDQQELAAAEQRLKELEDTCRELSQKTNQTNILINAEILNKEQRDKELLKAESELNRKLADAEQERAQNQARLDELNRELNRLTAGVIQPLLEDIAKAERTLQEKGSQVVLQQYQQLLEEKQQLVRQVEDTLAKLPPLQQELAEQRGARDKAESDLIAIQTSIRETTAEHDRLLGELARLNSREERDKLDSCQQRLNTLISIRQALIERSRESGFGMDYKDTLDSAIRLAGDTMRDVQAQITAYTDLFSKKLGS